MLMTMVLGAMAQGPVPVNIKVKVTVHNKETKKDINERVTYSRMLTKKEAIEAHAAIERLTGDKSPNDMNVDLDQEAKVKLLLKKYGFIEKNRTSAKGYVELSTATTMCYLFITGQENKVSDIMEVVPGKTEYELTINVQRLQEVYAEGKLGEREEIGGGTGDPDDGNEYFKVKMKLLKGGARSHWSMRVLNIMSCRTSAWTITISRTTRCAVAIRLAHRWRTANISPSIRRWYIRKLTRMPASVVLSNTSLKTITMYMLREVMPALACATVRLSSWTSHRHWQKWN